jgi:hypothetical protein
MQFFTLILKIQIFLLFLVYLVNSSKLKVQKSAKTNIQNLEKSSLSIKENALYYYNNTKQSYVQDYLATDIICQNSNCYLPYGVCINSTSCMCMPDFADYNKEGESIPGYYCSYKRKKIVIAGVLELFLPFGIGHFYCERYSVGSIKLIFTLMIYILACVSYSMGIKHYETIQLSLLCILMTCAVFLWSVVDLFLFFTAVYDDGNGIGLA